MEVYECQIRFVDFISKFFNNCYLSGILFILTYRFFICLLWLFSEKINFFEIFWNTLNLFWNETIIDKIIIHFWTTLLRKSNLFTSVKLQSSFDVCLKKSRPWTLDTKMCFSKIKENVPDFDLENLLNPITFWN